MLVTYVDRCVACSCSSLRDEGGRRPVPGMPACGSGCACHLTVPAHLSRAARATAASASHDAIRFRLLRRGRGAVRTVGQPAAR